MPNLARSCFGPPVSISSMAQQARPKVAGQTERARAQPASLLHRGQQHAARQLFFKTHG